MTFIVDNGSSYIMLQKEFLENNPELTLGSLKLLSVNNLIREIGNKIELYSDKWCWDDNLTVVISKQ